MDEKERKRMKKPLSHFPFSYFIAGNGTMSEIVGYGNESEINGCTKTNRGENIKRKLVI
jgi:hypothetical protein